MCRTEFGLGPQKTAPPNDTLCGLVGSPDRESPSREYKGKRPYRSYTDAGQLRAHPGAPPHRSPKRAGDPSDPPCAGRVGACELFSFSRSSMTCHHTVRSSTATVVSHSEASTGIDRGGCHTRLVARRRGGAAGRYTGRWGPDSPTAGLGPLPTRISSLRPGTGARKPRP